MKKEWGNAVIMGDNVNQLHSRILSLAQALGFKLDPVLLDNDLGGWTVGAENDDEKKSSTTTTATGTTEALPSSSSSPPTTNNNIIRSSSDRQL
jgi:hypothetical protein